MRGEALSFPFLARLPLWGGGVTTVLDSPYVITVSTSMRYCDSFGGYLCPSDSLHVTADILELFPIIVYDRNRIISVFEPILYELYLFLNCGRFGRSVGTDRNGKTSHIMCCNRKSFPPISFSFFYFFLFSFSYPVLFQVKLANDTCI